MGNLSKTYKKNFKKKADMRRYSVPVRKLRTRTTNIATYQNQEEEVEPNLWLI